MKSVLRFCLTFLAVSCLAVFLPKASLHADTQPLVSLNVQNAGPRKVEDTTERSVVRDYGAAWKAMRQALDQNRTDVLNLNFTGTASDKLIATISSQRKSGLHQRIVDKGHNVEATFYSPEGSAMELHDTAQVQLQLMDGSKVIHSEDATLHYVVLLTAAENSWKVRVLEAVPGF
jgi:beta-galactosidase/beta-glucuronidase